MKKITIKYILCLLVLVMFMSTGVAAQGSSTRDAGDLAKPGFSLRYLESFGINREPYVFTNDHIYHPMGLFVDSTGALFVAEQNGHRVMKFDAISGDFEMEFGEVGQPWAHDHYLYRPQGVVVDADDHVWVVMMHAIKEFSPIGEILQIFPEENPGEEGVGNDRLDGPFQPIFSNDGSQLFVSEMYNNRVQIFNVNTDPDDDDNSLTYAGTIDSANLVDDDDFFNQPHGLAFDSSNRLYVVDFFNHRVVRCELDAPDWVCDTFIDVTGVGGDPPDRLSFSVGVYIHGDYIFVADGGNRRVLRCEITPDPVVCVVFVDSLTFLTGITGDAAGNIYVSDKDNHRVQVYTAGGVYVTTYGIDREPYAIDNVRMNKPVGIAIGADNSMYVTEGMGHRLIKMDANGNQVWTVGEAGIYGDKNDQFGTFWGHMQGNPAVSADNKIYVADSPNNRIQVFNADGSYDRTYGVHGDGNGQFDFPTNVAISPVNGDIYVADSRNHRVQVFNANLVYKATLGVTGVSGVDDQHFNNPWDVAIDTAGNVYVADFDNFRVQKCSSSYICQTLIGETGVYNYKFAQVVPRNVSVDAIGRVYVADDWSSSLKVFDSTGAFLTSVGGDWGSNTSQFSSVGGVAFDTNGDVYVVDPDNHRIQKFTIGVPDWSQANINGFGERSNFGVGAMEIFNGQLYLGTRNWLGEGGAVYRSTDGTDWTRASEPGFGDTTNAAIIDMIEFKGHLYASTGWGEGGVGQVWRSSDGQVWGQVVGDGFGNPNNYAAFRFEIYNDVLYVSTGNIENGSEIHRSLNGNPGSWEKVVDEGFGFSNNYAVTSFVIFGDDLYAAVENLKDGAQVWRSSNGSDWAQVKENGFGKPDNIHIGSIIAFDGVLFASTQNAEAGGEIWRSSDGTTWTNVVVGGINDPANYKIESLYVHNQQMFVVANNAETGLKVWRTDDGETFTQLIDDGFGDSNNRNTLWDASTIAFKNNLYIGTFNSVNGGELWRFGTGFNVYLPLILK